MCYNIFISVLHELLSVIITYNYKYINHDYIYYLLVENQLYWCVAYLPSEASIIEH
jgi:hypothetical protein